jgi:UDPglucose 6-dehydrogenase
MAGLGHTVVGFDIRQSAVELLAGGKAPFFEPELEDFLGEAIATGRLSFSSDRSSVAGCDVHFLCICIPQKSGEYAADLSHVGSAIETLIPFLNPGDLVDGTGRNCGAHCCENRRRECDRRSSLKPGVPA